MRKISVLLLLAILVIGFCGCRKNDNTSSSDTSSSNTVGTQSDTSIVSSEEVSSAESSESNSSAKQTQSTASVPSKKQNTSSVSSVASELPHGQDDVPPVPESLNWTSLAGEWEFYSTDERKESSEYFLISLSIDQEGHTDITSGGFVLPENASYDVTKNHAWKFNNTTYYLCWGWDEYYGNFMITQGKENFPILEMRCEDGVRYFLTDELKFKRIDNDTLQYVGDDYEPLGLRAGDTFKR